MKPETKEVLDNLRQTEEYWSDLALLQFTSDLARIMKERGVTKAALARMINCSGAYVTQVLSGNVNCTVSTLVKFSLALKAVVDIRVKDAESLLEEESAGDASIACATPSMPGIKPVPPGPHLPGRHRSALPPRATETSPVGRKKLSR